MTVQPSLHLLTDLLDALGWGYWVRDLANGEIFCSASFRRLHAIAPEAPFRWESFFARIHPDDRADVVAELEAAYRHGHGEIRYRYCFADGTVQSMSALIVVIETSEGRRLGIGINRFDQRHLMLQQALQEQVRTLKAVLDALPVGLMVFDSDLRLRNWNQLAFEILGLPESLAAEGSPYAELIRVFVERGEYGSGNPAELVAMRMAFAHQYQPYRFEQRCPDGRWQLVQSKPFSDAKGRPAGFVVTFADITPLKNSQAALNATLDRLQTF